MKCGCGNELMTGDIEGICTRCRNAMNQAKQWPQNLPQVGAYALLADVQAMIDEVLPLLAREDLWDDGGVIFNAHQIIYNFKCEHFSQHA